LGRSDIAESEKKAFLGMKEREDEPATGLALMITAQGGTGDGCIVAYGVQAEEWQLRATSQVGHLKKYAWASWTNKLIQRYINQGYFSLLHEAHLPSTIRPLSQTVLKDGIDDSFRRNAAKALGEIAKGDRTAIDALLQTLLKYRVNDEFRRNAAEALGKIAQGDRTAIDALLQILLKDGIDNGTRREIASVLGKIAKGDRTAIDTLSQTLLKDGIDDQIRNYAALVIGGVVQGNQAAIDSLVQILLKDGTDFEIGYSVIEAFFEKKPPHGDQIVIDAFSQTLLNDGIN